MFLRIFSISLTPVNPHRFSLFKFRSLLARLCSDHAGITGARAPVGPVLSRYPPIISGQQKTVIRVTGICQGADFLWQIVDGNTEILDGNLQCHIDTRDAVIRNEKLETTDDQHEYEFLTPWLALNQQNEKKFYLLQGKPARDVFMQKLLTTQLNTLAKSLESPPGKPITCTAQVRFIRERIDHQTVMVFKGRFRTNLLIPQYLGIGRSVSQGFGWVREIPFEADTYD